MIDEATVNKRSFTIALPRLRWHSLYSQVNYSTSPVAAPPEE